MENPLYDYWPIVKRPRLEWPNGARLAFWLAVNVEHYQFGRPGLSLAANTAQFTPDPQNHGWRDYGPRVGVWRLMTLLDQLNIRASVLLNSDVCERYPDIVEEGKKRNWVWLAHGKNNSTLQVGMSLEEEQKYLSEVVETIENVTGRQPQGWLGPALTETLNTPSILADLGLSYICDWCCDDQPFPVRSKSGRMISLPYGLELNDITLFLGKSMSGDQFVQTVVDQLEVLYEEGFESGRVMALALHPFIINQPFRHRYLREALEYVVGHKDVWVTTSDDIAAWYYEHYYDRALAEMQGASVN